MKKFLNVMGMFLIIGSGNLVAQNTGLVFNNTYVIPNDSALHAYKISTLAATSLGTYDHLHLLVTLNSNWASTSNSYIDATFSNRNSFAYQYTLRGSAISAGAALVAYQNGGGGIDIYLRLSGQGAYTAASYTVLENQQETVYANPVDVGSGLAGTLVFDSSSSSYLPSTYVNNSGNVGIGTTNPTSSLEVHNISASETTGGFNGLAGFYSNDASNPFGLSMTFIGAASLVNRTVSLQTQSQALANGGNLSLQPAGGNVGIGTTTPRSALDINGNVTFSDGTVQATAWNGTTLGGDYAEAIDVLGDRAAYEPGDVIVIDAASPGRFEKSSKAYSKLVAGVYSTKPGLVGRRLTFERVNKAAEVPMAMLGIVPTKVTTENGPIEPGDLLVSASKPGYAMKGTDSKRAFGAVLGKALAPLSSGNGIIEVMISIQ